MSVKLELSDDEARSLRDRWEQELIQHQGAADELAKKIAAIDTQLTGQISLLEPETKSGKRKKGENLHTLRSYLEALGMRERPSPIYTKQQAFQFHPVMRCSNATMRFSPETETDSGELRGTHKNEEKRARRMLLLNPCSARTQKASASRW